MDPVLARITRRSRSYGGAGATPRQQGRLFLVGQNSAKGVYSQNLVADLAQSLGDLRTTGDGDISLGTVTTKQDSYFHSWNRH